MEVWGKRNSKKKIQGNVLYLDLSFHFVADGLWFVVFFFLFFFTVSFLNQYVILSFLCKRVAALNLYHIDHFTSFLLGSKKIHSIVIALLFFIYILSICCQ